jgi:hypothetical protein
LFRFPLAVACAALLYGAGLGALNAKDRHKSDPPQDRIEVVAQLLLAGGSVTRFVVTQHYRRDYLYAESSGGKSVTLIDITDLIRPSVLAGVAPSNGGGNLVSAAGTAALIGDGGNVNPSAISPQTFRIMSFADPTHPVVKQEFLNVSAIGRDEKRNLIFLANPQGLWILQEKLAVDPELEKEWEHMMLDNR